MYCLQQYYTLIFIHIHIYPNATYKCQTINRKRSFPSNVALDIHILFSLFKFRPISAVALDIDNDNKIALIEAASTSKNEDDAVTVTESEGIIQNVNTGTLVATNDSENEGIILFD